MKTLVCLCASVLAACGGSLTANPSGEDAGTQTYDAQAPDAAADAEAPDAGAVTPDAGVVVLDAGVSALDSGDSGELPALDAGDLGDGSSCSSPSEDCDCRWLLVRSCANYDAGAGAVYTCGVSAACGVDGGSGAFDVNVTTCGRTPHPLTNCDLVDGDPTPGSGVTLCCR